MSTYFSSFVVLDNILIAFHSVNLALMAILVNHFHLLTILLCTQVLVCLCNSHSKNDPRCNKPFRCGRIDNLSYPFRHPGIPEYCGEPEFELTCDGSNTPMITINSQSYLVVALNRSLQSLTVIPINIESNLVCPQQPVNVSLNLSPFHLAWNTKNVTLYIDCSANANNSIWLSNHQLNCRMNNGTETVGYYVVTSDKLLNEEKDALRSCRSSVLVPVFASTLQALEQNPVSENLNLILSNGFGLTWKGNNSISGSSEGSISKLNLIIGLGVAGVATLAIITAMLVTFKLKKELLSKGVLLKKLRGGKSKDWEMIEDFISQYGSELAPKRYSYSDIKRITKSFKDEFGQGGFGMVYKGQLPDSRLVAVKVLCQSKARGEDFINEVASISRTSHVNIVAFLGFCFEGSIRALIYEFMPNGSLDQFICHPNSPDKSHHLEVKTTLYEIALGIARGLEYLHQGCSTRILHFDIKPHNILLDENFCPKISDFGLAKLCERKESILSTMSARGTIGYIAPEVFCRSFGGVSHKSDVYSYGMMILDMVGLKGDIHSPNSDTMFPVRIYELIKNGEDLDIRGMGVDDEDLNRKMIIVSLWCIQSNPLDRPSMTKVLEMLQGGIESLLIPPTPFLFSPPVLPEISSSSTLLVTQSNYTENNSDSV